MLNEWKKLCIAEEVFEKNFCFEIFLWFGRPRPTRTQENLQKDLKKLEKY